MQIAIIDLGTNTFNLVVATIEKDKNFSILFNDKISVKLGEGGIQTNYIQAVPFQRGVDAIKKHLLSVAAYPVQNVYAFATSAIRSSSNGNLFVEEVKKQFGIEVQVIDGNREAELIYEGVKLGVKLNSQKSLIMDIGGGSTEFIIANKKELFWKHSFNLGAARLLAKFNPSDPIKAEEIAALENYIALQTDSLEKALQKYEVSELIGSSGSFDTFAEVIAMQKGEAINLNLQSSYDFRMTDYFALHQQLLKSNKEERLTTPGIIEMRVDMIVVSSIFTNYILTKFQLPKMKLSTYALKEGVIAQLMNSTFLN